MKVCKSTGYPVVPSQSWEHSYYCPALDEDLYDFEVIDAPVTLDYEGFKGRKIDPSKPVMVYKNLHNGKLSIRQGKHVVAHVDSILLTDVSFVVREAGRQRVISEGRKNVHAFVKGKVVATNTGDHDTTDRRVSYNPYKHGYFYEVDTQDEATLTSNETLLCNAEHGLFII